MKQQPGETQNLTLRFYAIGKKYQCWYIFCNHRYSVPVFEKTISLLTALTDDVDVDNDDDDDDDPASLESNDFRHCALIFSAHVLCCTLNSTPRPVTTSPSLSLSLSAYFRHQRFQLTFFFSKSMCHFFLDWSIAAAKLVWRKKKKFANQQNYRFFVAAQIRFFPFVKENVN